MSAIASQITGVSIVYSTVCSGADQRKHQSSASLAFVRGIHRWPVDSPHKGPVTRKIFPFDDVIMLWIFRWRDHALLVSVLPGLRNSWILEPSWGWWMSATPRLGICTKTILSEPNGELTYWGRDKMAAIFRRHFRRHSFNENAWILLKISLKFVPKDPINITPALVQMLAWRRARRQAIIWT